MYSRDYVYVRRYDVDVENNLMILVSRYKFLSFGLIKSIKSRISFI